MSRSKPNSNPTISSQAFQSEFQISFFLLRSPSPCVLPVNELRFAAFKSEAGRDVMKKKRPTKNPEISFHYVEEFSIYIYSRKNSFICSFLLEHCWNCYEFFHSSACCKRWKLLFFLLSSENFELFFLFVSKRKKAFKSQNLNQFFINFVTLSFPISAFGCVVLCWCESWRL